jgi:predicted porin
LRLITAVFVAFSTTAEHTMNKKFITLAVAAALAAPGLASAEAILYGKVNVSLDYADVTNAIAPTFGLERDENGDVIFDRNGFPTFVQLTEGESFKGWGMSGNGYIPGVNRASRLGVKGSEDLGNGLKAIYQVEFGINLNDTNGNVLSNSDSITYRNTFVGLAGDWGTFLLGRHDTPMKISTGKLDLFADTMADYNGTVGFNDFRADNVVAYISPSWSGFQLAAAIVPAGGATGGGRGLNINEDSIGETWSIAAIYSNGPFYASAAFENLNNEHFNSQGESLFLSNCPSEGVVVGGRVIATPEAYTGSGFGACEFQDSDAQAYRFGLGLLDWNGFSLTAIYANQDQFRNDTYQGFIDPANPRQTWVIPNTAQDADLWQVQAGYSFGNAMLKAMYGQADYSGNTVVAGADFVSINGGEGFLVNRTANLDYTNDTWAVGADYNFSKRTKAYMLYTSVTSDLEDIRGGSQWDGFSLGMMHSF